MCTRVIVDNSVANPAHFLSTTAGTPGDIFRKWLESGNGIVTYSEASDDYKKALDNSRYKAKFLEYRRNGKLHAVSPQEYSAARVELSNKPLRSNDADLLSVALAGNATVLYSDDKPFERDFKNPVILTGAKRANYPHRSSTKGARQFLNQRKCPSRNP